MLALFNYSGTSELIVAFLLTVSSLTVAVNDVIVDSLMVIQSRRYPTDGSEQLQAYSWSCLALGGITGSVLAAFLTQNNQSNYCFLAASIPAAVLVVVTWRLTLSIE